MQGTRNFPYLEHYKLNKIKPTDIMKFYDLLEEDTQIIRTQKQQWKENKKTFIPKTSKPLKHHYDE